MDHGTLLPWSGTRGRSAQRQYTINVTPEQVFQTPFAKG